MDAKMAFRGHFIVEHYDGEGNLKATYRFPNGIKDEGGIEFNLDVFFGAVSASATWYIGLIDNAGFTSDPAGDTMADHANWTESQDYTEAVRQTWTVGAAASRSITNAATVDFSINGNVALKGIFIVDVAAWAPGNTGNLWSTALFPSVVNAVDNDTLKITYSVSG